MKTHLVFFIASIIALSTIPTSSITYATSTQTEYDNPPASAGNPGLHWNLTPGSSITYRHNTIDLPDISGIGERTEANTAFTTWTNDVASYVSFTDGGTTTNTASLVLTGTTDGQNVVQYEASLECNGSPDPIAQTGWAGTALTGIIVESDTAFNSACFTFSNATPTPSTAYDLQTIALHEFGHWLLLDDLSSSSESSKVMYFSGTLGLQRRALTTGDQAGVRYIYAEESAAGTSIGSETQGSDIAVGLVNSGTTKDYVFAWADNPIGANTIKYSYSMDISSTTGKGGTWAAPASISSVGSETQGIGVALQQINNDVNGRPDLVIVWIDNPSGVNTIKYRIGWDVSTLGVPSSWSVDKTMPSSDVGSESQGLGIAFVDTPDSGTIPEIFVFWIDNPSGTNKVYYKVGWNINTSGDATSWSTRFDSGINPGTENQGLGASIGRFTGTATSDDILIFWIDNPSGNNLARYRVGQDITSTGSATWSFPFQTIPNGWRVIGTESQGAGVTVFDANGDSKPEATFVVIDNPIGSNSGKLRTEWIGKMGSSSHE